MPATRATRPPRIQYQLRITTAGNDPSSPTGELPGSTRPGSPSPLGRPTPPSERVPPQRPASYSPSSRSYDAAPVANTSARWPTSISSPHDAPSLAEAIDCTVCTSPLYTASTSNRNRLGALESIISAGPRTSRSVPTNTACDWRSASASVSPTQLHAHAVPLAAASVANATTNARPVRPLHRRHAMRHRVTSTRPRAANPGQLRQGSAPVGVEADRVVRVRARPRCGGAAVLRGRVKEVSRR